MTNWFGKAYVIGEYLAENNESISRRCAKHILSFA